jgi:hypothetical protein
VHVREVGSKGNAHLWVKGFRQFSAERKVLAIGVAIRTGIGQTRPNRKIGRACHGRQRLDGAATEEGR